MATFQDFETKEQTTIKPFSFSRSVTDNQLENQMDISQVSTTPYYQSYQTPTIEREEYQTPSYEVEKEYNIDTLPEDEVIIPTFMPLLKSEAETKQDSNYKIRLNARGKILVSAFSIIVGILIAFMVYNAVVISNLSNKLESLSVDQSTKETQVLALKSDYQDISSYKHLEMEAGNLGFSYSPETDDILVTLPARPEIPQAKRSPNLFNSICEFFAELFN